MSASPIMTLFREFEVKYRQAGDMTFKEEIASGLLDECKSLEKRILAAPTTNVQDFAAKLIVETRYNDFVLGDRGSGGLLDEALGLLAVHKHPDAALIDLGRQFETAFAAEEAARMIGRETDDWSAWDEAYAVTEAIVQKIETVPATSLEGFRVKARCVQWCYGDDPVFRDTDRQTTDVRIAQQIVRDLLGVSANRLGGRTDV